MPLYSFHSFRADGSPVGLDTAEFDDIAGACAHVPAVFTEHTSCQLVVVCLGESEVGSFQRPAKD